jgi:hypothetical protein
MAAVTTETGLFTLPRRSLPGQLRYLADRLTEGADPVPVAGALKILAGLQHEEENLRERLEHAEAALAGRSEGIRLWMLDCAEVASANRQRADKAEAEVARLESELAAALEENARLDREQWIGER